MSAPPSHAARPSPGRRRLMIVIVVSVIAVAALAAVVVLWPRESAPVAVTPSPQTTTTPTATPTPSPTPTGFPADEESYDLSALPAAEVFAVIPELPVDADPDAPFTGETARPASESIPVWADPNGEPVAQLPREQRYGGTTVPIVERQEHWVRVLLTGRQAIPSEGDPGQLSGWLRVDDVEIGAVEGQVEVSLSERTIDIVTPGGTERVADDFASGTEATPTPLGRSFIMLVEVVPRLTYARGHPLVYLSVQSPTLDDFGGEDVAVTAFHYHDTRAGAISNGCIRLDATAIDRLAQLPPGTPVVIRE